MARRRSPKKTSSRLPIAAAVIAVAAVMVGLIATVFWGVKNYPRSVTSGWTMPATSQGGPSGLNNGSAFGTGSNARDSENSNLGKIVPDVSPMVDPLRTKSKPFQNPELVATLRAAALFRHTATKSWEVAVKAVVSSPANEDQWPSKLNKTEYKHLWPFFFSGSLILTGRLAAESPVIVFYNPYVDAAFFTLWKRDLKHPKIQSAMLLLASDFPSGQVLKDKLMPRWMGDNGSIAGKIIDGYRGFRDSFEALHPLLSSEAGFLPETSSEEATRICIEQRCLAITLQIGRFVNQSEANSDTLTALRALLGVLETPSEENLAGFLPAVNPVKADVLSRLGKPLLGRMRPTLVLESESGAMVVLIDASTPNLMLDAHFGRLQKAGLLSLVPFTFDVMLPPTK